MKPEPPDIKSVFAEALEKTEPGDRANYLDGVCGKGTPLRAEVESLLISHERAEGFLPSPDLDRAATLDSAALVEGPGTLIGQYKLLERIGEGGMAVVYMAEQKQPMRRKVALKIIKLGMDTRQIIARFEAERQALALLDHPNIARVFDAGATDTGRPYFVMELVHGVSITEYCDRNILSTKDRLGLFIQVCHAVQHAHHKGIIHRDLKPSNVMVTMHDDRPVPKVIDFGIAKATNQRLTEKTLFTRYAHMIGTPAYMSPEQAQMSGLDVDTRTDIYSLGVLLYELLTGTTPFAPETLEQAGYAEIERIVRETDPPRPSTRLRTLGQGLTDLARRRQTSAEALPKLIKGDLDWIVMTCLEKDRVRRYETAHELSADVERHLKHEPILARSPGAVYRLQKFTRRNRSRILVASIAAMLLVAFMVAVLMYRRASKLQWAQGEALPRIVELVKEGDYRAAFSLARQARKYIPGDATLAELWPRLSKRYSITTTPAGAEVFYRDHAAPDEPWRYLGRSPVDSIILPQRTYRWKIEKHGYATHECVVDGSFAVQLREHGSTPEMVWMDSFTAQGPSDDSGQRAQVHAPAYLMEKYEVTNRQFQAFVDANGYGTRDYWQELDFVRDGRTLDWSEAVKHFDDRTDYLAPATWREGRYPKGQAEYPVSGVSWFEAVAYARFADKDLPTLYHWEHAACLDESAVVIPHSNFSAEGITPVGTHPGMGHTGLYDMAGNVKEWCMNATDNSNNSQRYILGGGWGEQTYMFGVRDFRSPWDRAAVNGLRCVQYPGGEESVPDVLLGPVPRPAERRDYSTAEPCSDEEFRVIKQQFDYDQTPLQPEVEHIDDSPSFWRREKITFDAAYGGERMIAYLFVPKAVRPPYQVVIYWPGTASLETRVFEGLPERDFTELIILSGRALLWPVYKGSFERRTGTGNVADPRTEPHAFRDWIVQDCKDLRRSIDYLETREDLDHERLAYYGMSAGAAFGPMVLAVENRFRAAVLVVGGFPVRDFPDAEESAAIVDPLNHAPRCKTPVLMVNGKEDFVFPYETSQRPLFECLGTPDEHKDHKVYPGGHGLLGLFMQQIRGDVLGWLDRYLGPVSGKRHSDMK